MCNVVVVFMGFFLVLVFLVRGLVICALGPIGFRCCASRFRILGVRVVS